MRIVFVCLQYVSACHGIATLDRVYEYIEHNYIHTSGSQRG